MTRAHAKTLQLAILATFTGDANTAARAFDEYGERDWRRLGSWLDASGLALYFLEEVRRLCLRAVIPCSVLEDLQNKQLANCDRTEAMLEEFLRVNHAFFATGLQFANLKGFTLAPEYCPTPSLRSQFDLDFWVVREDADRWKTVLSELGYELVGISPASLEFSAGERQHARIRELYQPARRRLVEIHLHDNSEFEGSAIASRVIGGLTVPVLTREGIFVQQCAHLTKHIRSEWTRASWMLELRNAICAASSDDALWCAVCATSGRHAIDVGIAAATAAKVFGFAVPAELAHWSVAALPPTVARWIETFAVDVATAKFPGSKNYLLLERELTSDSGSYAAQRRRKLFPVRLPGAITVPQGLQHRLQSLPSHLRHFQSRLQFHLRESIRFVRAERAWRRSLDAINGEISRAATVPSLGHQ
ncbi:MAG TPA: nucleotidyltransferase family protein [Candidatus Koribacter sp.]|jgi:hypothetical protein